MSGVTEKIIEISLAKIENSKTLKVNGKSGVLHRNLLVNSLLNRVKTKDPLMNYRESKLNVDLEIDDYDMDRLPTRDLCQQRQIKQQISTTKQSSLVTKLNTRSIGKQDTTLSLRYDDVSETKENKSMDVITNTCQCSKDIELNCFSCNHNKAPSKKRLLSLESSEEDCPRKRLRCLWTPNVSTKRQDSSFSITSLSSLFGNLVADADSEKNLVLQNKFVSAMVAC